MSTSAAIVRLETAAQPCSLMAAAVGFYFAFRYATEYLFFQSDPRTGAAFSVALNIMFFAMVLFHSLGNAPQTCAWSCCCCAMDRNPCRPHS
jgi:hypothetical protein